MLKNTENYLEVFKNRFFIELIKFNILRTFV